VVVALWSVKGGSGTTTAAAALACVAGCRDPAGALLVDLDGDAPLLHGADPTAVPGVAEWLLTEGALDPPGCGWTAPTLRGGEGVYLVPRGSGPLGARPAARRRAEMLSHLLAADPRQVVIDCGTLGVTSLDQEATCPAHVLARQADRSLLVTRACALALRRLRTTLVPINGIILLAEPGRMVLPEEIEQAAGAPIVAVVPHDPAVAEAVDAGTFADGLPIALADAVGPLLIAAGPPAPDGMNPKRREPAPDRHCL
jgi:cellulose biosynthesis protein BcsQ